MLRPVPVKAREADGLRAACVQVRAGSAMAASDGVEVYEHFRWSNQLGVRP